MLPVIKIFPLCLHLFVLLLVLCGFDIFDTMFDVPGDKLFEKNGIDTFTNHIRTNTHEHQVDGIILSHRGEISLSSREGEGTEVALRLPDGMSEVEGVEEKGAQAKGV